MTICSQSYTFDPRPHRPFLITAKRYWKPESPYLNDNLALTLVFAHGTGFHKEQWEPTIEELYLLLEPSGSAKVRDIWAIDAPNHGDAAVLNEGLLKDYNNHSFPWEEYGLAIHAFLTNYGTGIDVEFRTRRLVGIGHSKGAICLLLSLGYSSKLKYESLILCELLCMNSEHLGKLSDVLAKGAASRRDTWPSREEAYTLLKSRPAWRAWDDRVLKIFVRHGMRDLPNYDYPDRTEGVTLKCPRLQEEACYRDIMVVPRVYNALGEIARRLPIHLIYGAINDHLPQSVKNDIVENAVGGVENLASFSRVEGAGHLIVQMNPSGLAQKIYKALILCPSRAVKL